MQIPPWKFAQIQLLCQKLLDQNMWDPAIEGAEIWTPAKPGFAESTSVFICHTVEPLWLGDLCWLPAAHPAPLNRTGEENNLERLERERQFQFWGLNLM